MSPFIYFSIKDEQSFQLQTYISQQKPFHVLRGWKQKWF